MKIEKIVLTHVRIPLRDPFRISSGSVSEKDSIIVAMHSEGFIGYGEASPMSGSFYSDDTPDSVWAQLVSVIGPAILAARPDTLEDVDDLLNDFGGSGFARAGAETAAWDLDSRISGRPLHSMLGGMRPDVASGLAVGIYQSVEILLRRIGEYLCEGYKRIKIKIEKGWDAEPLTAIRKHFGDIPLMVDANCAYDRKDIEYLRRLDEFGLMMIEQPLKKDDLEGHAQLQSLLNTPVCLDESAEDISQVRNAITLGSCRIVNIKIQRVGGFGNAKAIHDLCYGSGLGVWAGTMPELGIGGIHALLLSTLPGFTYPTDVESSERWFLDDIVVPRLKVCNGTFKVSDYSSYDIDTTVLQKYKVKETALTLN